MPDRQIQQISCTPVGKSHSRSAFALSYSGRNRHSAVVGDMQTGDATTSTGSSDIGDLDRRLTRVETTLPQLATKEDLAGLEVRLLRGFGEFKT